MEQRIVFMEIYKIGKGVTPVTPEQQIQSETKPEGTTASGETKPEGTTASPTTKKTQKKTPKQSIKNNSCKKATKEE